MVPLEQMKKLVDEKTKTGDLEHLRIIWAASTAIRIGEGFKEDKENRDRFVTTMLTYLSEELSGLGRFIETLGGFASDRIPGKILDKQKNENIKDLVERLERVHGSVARRAGAETASEFVINLILFDFRTADGGRVRKSTSSLREGADEYARPFESRLPHYAEYLLRATTMPRVVKRDDSSKLSVIDIVVSDKTMYVPPTRFTASFPLAIDKTQPSPDKSLFDNPRISKKPETPEPETTVRYKFLPSFGFAEPGYCTWEQGARSEYSGTRFSPGAYSLNPVYLEHLRGLQKQMDPATQVGYEQYGGVGSTHLDALSTVLSVTSQNGWQRGPDLAIAWAAQLARIAEQLCVAASQRFPELKSFFDFIVHKIEARRRKLEFIRQFPTSEEAKTEGSPAFKNTLFDRVWVIESSLWEFAFLAASCLSCQGISTAITELKTHGGPFATWSPSVSLDDSLHDQVSVNKSSAFERFYFSSGTSAAESIYEHLLEQKFAPYTLKADRKVLSTYTPYFEFYQPDGSLLSPEKNKALPFEPVGYQVWYNLSEGLHANLLRVKNTNIGQHLAELLADHILKTEKLVTGGFSPMCLVIDYTKFAGESPNTHIYPILSQLAIWLTSLLGKEHISGIVFLRSNLKYNTGSLDRYQSGELLVAAGNTLNIKHGLLKKAEHSFTAKNLPGDWNLHGAYVPLMKKLYVLSDAVGYMRWGVYSSLWGEGKGIHSLSTALPTKLPKDILTIRKRLVSIFRLQFDVLFNNLAAHCSGKKKLFVLPADTVVKIKHLNRRVREDIVFLENITSETSPELELQVRRMLGYLKMVREIELAMRGAKRPDGQLSRSVFFSSLSKLQNLVGDIQQEQERLEGLDSRKQTSPPRHSEKTAGVVWNKSSIEEDRHWYTDDEIDTLLTFRLDGHDHVYRMGSIDAHLHDGFTLLDNLREARNNIINTSMRVIVVPLNINRNHWTALYLGFARNDVERRRPTIRYIDPLRNHQNPPDWLRIVITLLFGNLQIAGPNRQYQFDGHNCGPLTVALLEHMALNDGQQPTAPIDAAARRAEDARLIQEHNPMYCEACHRRRTEVTGSLDVMSRWHRCTSCRKVMCGTCGSARPRTGTWQISRVRQCTCGGTTELIN